MKKIIFLFSLTLVLSGCATYKFNRGQTPPDKGYVVSRDDYAILEYTLGKDNTVPDNVKLAKERFKRRRNMVEHYYKKMGYIENHFKMVFWDPPILFLKFITGIFRLPCYAISDYKYEHNAKYRERIKKREEEKEAQEEARIKKLKETLNTYIQKDLAAESPKETQLQKAPPKEEEHIEKPVVEKIESKGAEIEQKVQEVIPSEKVEQVEQKAPETEKSVVPKVVIIAKPTKGLSPLTVHFYGHKSYSPHGKIVSYFWDFGDGDTSTKVNPINTYYSGSFESKHINATLTVQDNKGNTATASIVIEVLNK